jgi:hypothetical protein
MQVRRFTGLYYEQYSQSAHIIGDHESRACDTPFGDGRIKRPIGGCSNLPSSNGVSRKIDFHDTELFLEVEYPVSTRITIIQCSRPENWRSRLVVEVDKIEPGGTLEIDTGDDLVKPREMFLTKRDIKGVEQWWECRWKNS